METERQVLILCERCGPMYARIGIGGASAFPTELPCECCGSGASLKTLDHEPTSEEFQGLRVAAIRRARQLGCLKESSAYLLGDIYDELTDEEKTQLAAAF